MSSVLTELISLLVGGITGIATGIGQGLTSLVEAIFVSKSGSAGSETYSLTTFGALIAVFGGIALAVGLSRLVVGWVMSLGGRN